MKKVRSKKYEVERLQKVRSKKYEVKSESAATLAKQIRSESAATLAKLAERLQKTYWKLVGKLVWKLLKH